MEFFFFFLPFFTVVMKGGGLEQNLTEPILNFDKSTVPFAESSLAIPGLSGKPDGCGKWQELSDRYIKNINTSELFYRTKRRISLSNNNLLVNFFQVTNLPFTS